MGQKRKLNSPSNSTARKKRNILKNNVNSNSATLETIFVRFPHLTEAIFGELDIPSLSLCREWNKMWKENLENSRTFRILWIKMIETTTKLFDRKFKKEWRQILVKIPLEMLKNLANGVFYFVRNRKTCQDFAGKYLSIRQYSPLHAAVQYGCIHGDLSLFQYTLARMEIKNPKDGDGMTPLHIAAQLSNLEITKQILKKVNGKIPTDNFGRTPHHYAALNGDLNMFKTLFDHFTDKIQQSNGVTPLYYAAKNGGLDICKLIVTHSSYRSNLWRSRHPKFIIIRYRLGDTPLHIAAKEGHLKVCKLLFKYMEIKNPQNNSGKTPLHLASENNQWKVVHYLIRANKLHV